MKTDCPVVEPWGAYWIDGLACELCGHEWPDTGGGAEGPPARQYLTIHLGDGGTTICPDCADDLYEQLARTLDDDVPMAKGPDDTAITCALPDAFYWTLRDPDEVYWDGDTHTLRFAESGDAVPIRRELYRKARQQLARMGREDWFAAAMDHPVRMRPDEAATS